MRVVVLSSFAFEQVQTYPEEPFNPSILLTMCNEYVRHDGNKKKDMKPFSESIVVQLKTFYVSKDPK